MPESEHVEGAARLLLTPNVFFNPKQRLQRDLSLLAVHVFAEMTGSDLALLDALAGCGVRALRFLLEVPLVKKVVVNDCSAEAIAAMRASALHSDLSVRPPIVGATDCLQTICGSTLSIRSEPAATLMASLHAQFDVVDLDPCGSVADLLLPAMNCLRDGGLLMASCTDLGSLRGRFGSNTQRYGSIPLAGAQKQSPELVMRALLGCVAQSASTIGRRVRPQLSVVFEDFFVRVIVIVDRADRCDQSSSVGSADCGETDIQVTCDSDCNEMRLLSHCADCGILDVQNGEGASNQVHCKHCGSRSISVGGPFWMGPTGDANFLRRIISRLEQLAPKDESSVSVDHRSPECRFGSLAVLRPLLNALLLEASSPLATLPFPVPALCRVLRCKRLSTNSLATAIGLMGHECAISHWDPMTLKAPVGATGCVWEALVAWSELYPHTDATAADTGDGITAEQHRSPFGDGNVAEGVRKRLIERYRSRSAVASDYFRDGSISSLRQQKRRKLQPPDVPAKAISELEKASRLANRTPDGRHSAYHERGKCKFSPDSCGFPFTMTETSDLHDETGESPRNLFISQRATVFYNSTTASYQSIALAIGAAPAGSTIYVGKGDYVETSTVSVHHSVVVLAERGAKLVGHGRGPVLLVDCGGGAQRSDGEPSSVDIRGLEVAQLAVPNDASVSDSDLAHEGTASRNQNSERGGYAVVVRKGRATLTHCAITSSVTGCCFVSAAAHAELQSCQLRKAAAHGVLVSGTATARLLHCHVASTGAAAIEVRGRAKAFVHGCRVHHSERSGIYATAFSELQIEWSNIFSCTFAGIESSGQAETHVRNCRIHHGARGGLLALNCSVMHIQDCSIYRNSMAGLSARGNARVAVQNTNITEGRTSGVHIAESATAELRSNTISCNRLCGVEVDGPEAKLISDASNVYEGNQGDALSVPGALALTT